MNRDETHNLSLCPDGESHPHPFGVCGDAPTNRATRPGRGVVLFTGECSPLFSGEMIEVEKSPLATAKAIFHSDKDHQWIIKYWIKAIRE